MAAKFPLFWLLKRSSIKAHHAYDVNGLEHLETERFLLLRPAITKMQSRGALLYQAGS
jgi:hypothetical protein